METPDHKTLPSKSQTLPLRKRLRGWWASLRYGKGPQSVPHRLDRAALAALLADAQMLQGYGVEVREMPPGEEPGHPVPAGEIPPNYGAEGAG